mgnify:CR=1 FL=1
MKRRKFIDNEPINMTREEELKLMADFIERKGVTKLAPDERIQMNTISHWTKSKDKKKVKGK